MKKEWYWSRSASKKERENPGCMRGMFHFLDFHHLLFTGVCRAPATDTSPPATELPYQYQQEQQQRYCVAQCKGVEAPRNSLEFEDSNAAIREDYYGVPISIQIAHPSALAKKKKELLLEEERRKSQAVTPRTRSIVARLMGLEGLHDNISSPCLTCYESTSTVSFSGPTFSECNESSKEKKKKMSTKNQQSIQENKKDSPSPRRPLQILNSNILGSISLPDTPRASSEGPRDADARRSLQHNKENNGNYTMQELSFLREVMPASSTLLGNFRKKDCMYEEENKSTKNQHFSREIVKEKKNKQPEKKYIKNNQFKQHSPSSINSFKPRVKPESKTLKMEPEKCRKTTNYERFTEKVSRQPPLHTVLNLGTVRLQPAEKEQKPLKNHFNVEKEDPEFRYVKAILSRADIIGNKSMNWFSPSLPIDPTIFHILELWFPFFEPGSKTRLGLLKHRSNRKLLFHLVEEILGDLLLSEPKRWRRQLDSKLLLSRLWSEIKMLPSVAGDIDTLVGGELPESRFRRLLRHPSVVAEVQDIASEIQRDVLDSLLGETAESLVIQGRK